MKNKLGWFILTLWVAGMLYIMSGLASAKVINSDPEFMKAGPKSYACKTPKGRTVLCNKWSAANRSGWKQSCTPAGVSVFSKLSDPYEQQILLGEDSESRQCVMLFDEARADYRKLFKNKKKQAKEDTRLLHPAVFDQKVVIKEEGNYELSSCMARRAGELDSEYDELANQGGITVSLIEWHKHTNNSPTWHVILPENKATFGLNGTLEGAKHFDLIVGSIEEAPDAGEMPLGSVVGVPPYGASWAEAHIHSPGGLMIEDGYGRDMYYVDGFDGHAGLVSKYAGGIRPIDYPDGTFAYGAEWSCYSAVRALSPGFYVLSAEIKPRFTCNAPEFLSEKNCDTTDYFGFGAIRNIELRRID